MSEGRDMRDRLVCQSCGAPGELRHAPPPAPVSGVWCERCHARLQVRSNGWSVARHWRLLLFVALVAGMFWIQRAGA